MQIAPRLTAMDARDAARRFALAVGAPVLAFALFLGLWSALAQRIHTSLGVVPGPVQVVQQAQALWTEHRAEAQRRKDFYARQEERIQERLKEEPGWAPERHAYPSRPTYITQIGTSLLTVFAGFLLATLVAVPLGILAGSSRVVQAAINPIVQLFRPVSPLAWLPIVTLVVSALYTSGQPVVEKSFLISAITVTLCSLWPTLINTAIGIASVDPDLVNVGRVLQLPLATRVRRILLPSALPYIFTGMRLSLGVGWMVLIAAEMLAQNPGLGKFVWDEFQNGSSESLGRIMVAVFTIGAIGFALDRLMQVLQQLVSHK